MPAGEPLALEDGAFVEAVKSGKPPAVSGEDGLRALDLIEQSSVPVELLVTDVVMPRVGGRELAARLGAREDPLQAPECFGLVVACRAHLRGHGLLLQRLRHDPDTVSSAAWPRC